MVIRARVLASLVFFLLAAARAGAVDFDCIALPANPQQRPSDCDANPDPSGWCNCLKTGIFDDQAGSPSNFSQAIINVVKEPVVGKYEMMVDQGVLDLSTVAIGDSIGEIVVDVAIPGSPDNFYLDFSFMVTDVQQDNVSFDITVIDTNDATKGVLTYDPTDAEHANGITYRGTVLSNPTGGFTLSFAYVDDVTTLPGMAISTGIEIGDLSSPNFTVPMLLTFPGPNLYTNPDPGPIGVNTTVAQVLVDPPVTRTFTDSFPLKAAKPVFRRGDANVDGKVDLTDAVKILGFLFLGNVPSLSCQYAADANDDGKLDLTDPVAILNYLFVGNGQIPDPGPNACGEQIKANDLPACTYDPSKC